MQCAVYIIKTVANSALLFFILTIMRNPFKLIFGSLLGAALTFCVACAEEQPAFKVVDQPEPSTTNFASGADISWVTKFENVGVKFYNEQGNERECTALMKEIGMNTIRLRVWVNPADGWCNIDDVLAKALRAKEQGMRIMINFHYSDSWADPGQQYIPKAWENYTIDEMKDAVANHTKEVLQVLQQNQIDVEWVQVGNETTTGMLWPMGDAKSNMGNYAELSNAGYDAVKSIYPAAKVIIHVDKGNELSRFTWLFDGLRRNKAKWDVIGMSLYPEVNTWETENQSITDNIKTLFERYGTECMIVEVGMSRTETAASRAFLTDLFKKAMHETDNRCQGILYWEPECYTYETYDKGAFTNDGRPSEALIPFGEYTTY